MEGKLLARYVTEWQEEEEGEEGGLCVLAGSPIVEDDVLTTRLSQYE